MTKAVLIIVVFLMQSFLLSAQINFINPGFEGNINSLAPPEDWITCSYFSPFTSPLPYDPYIKAFQGKTYLSMESGNINDTIHESVGQKLSCNLVKGKLHHFSLYTYHTSYVLWQYGSIEFWAGSKLCSKEKLLWSAQVLDTSWTEFTPSFVPDSSYDYILFTSTACDTCFQTTLGLDALSEIIVDNYNLLSVPFSDTVINKWSCVNLVANSDDTTGHFVWSSIPVGFNANGSLVSVCPTENTQYVCTITSGCGYQKSDTVNVEVTPNGVANVQGGEYLSIYPNPASNVINVSYTGAADNAWFTLYDMLGEEVANVQLNKGNGIMRYNSGNLANGLYFWRVTGLNDSKIKEGKIVIAQP